MTGPRTQRVEPWGLVFGEPDCSLRVAGAAGPVIATLAGKLGHEGLRVVIADDGRSITAKTRAISLGTLLQLAMAKLVFPSVMTLVVAEEGPAGTRVDIAVRGGDTRVVRTSIPRALSLCVDELESRGMQVDVGPWERRSREPRPS